MNDPLSFQGGISPTGEIEPHPTDTMVSVGPGGLLEQW